jgi:hypothetical protein
LEEQVDWHSVTWWGDLSLKAGSGEGAVMVEGEVVSGVLSVMVVSRVAVVTGREKGLGRSVLCGEGKSVRKGSRVGVGEGDG